MKGFIDCILKDSSDNYIIVDFKLKYLPKRDDEDFQLPMYITLTEENEEFKVYTALFYSIIDLKSEVFDRDWYNNIFEEFNNKTEQFAQEISTGNFSVFVQNNNDCYDCDYHRICRTVYIIGRHQCS
jgi:hypothetical protein